MATQASPRQEYVTTSLTLERARSRLLKFLKYRYRFDGRLLHIGDRGPFHPRCSQHTSITLCYTAVAIAASTQLALLLVSLAAHTSLQRSAFGIASRVVYSGHSYITVKDQMPTTSTPRCPTFPSSHPSSNSCLLPLTLVKTQLQSV